MAATREIRIERSVVLVYLVQVASRIIALPDFDKCPGNGPSVLVDYSAADNNSFPEWRAGVLLR